MDPEGADLEAGTLVPEEVTNAAEQPPSTEQDLAEAGDKAIDKTIEEEGDYCRICRGEGTTEQPLFYPCKCSGSIKFVHQDCLMEWLSHSQKKYCELCKTPFTFTKLYDRTMPQTLPLPLFLRQLIVHSARGTLKWARFFLVGFVWLGWLPWSIRQVWRGLFWLADGSWVSPSALDSAVALAETTTALAPGPAASSSSLVLTEVSNATIQADIASVIPSILAPVAGFFTVTTNDFLVVKIVRLLFPAFTHWVTEVIYGTALSEAGSDSISTTRPPSLLSDVSYFKTFTAHSVLNNAVIDVLEGQLICILVVTAFILIFLIREWVINQQPAANIPDPDRVDAPVVPPQANGEARPVVRRRRRGFRDALDQRERGPNPGRPIVVDGVRPAAAPQRSRTNSVENPEGRPARADSPNAWPLSARGTTALRQPSNSVAAGRDRNDSTHGSRASRPIRRSRHALGQAVDIRRQIEEGDSFAELGYPEIGTASSSSLHEDEASWIDEVDSNESDTEHLDDESSTKAIVGSISSNTDDLDSLALLEKVSNYQEQVQDDTLSSEGSISRLSGIVVTPETGSMEEFGVNSGTEGEEVTATPDSTSNEGEPTENVNHELEMTTFGFWDRIANWLWHTEGYIPVQEEILPENDEQIVEDVDGEPPFVPARVRQDALDPDEIVNHVEQAVPPALPQDNPFGIDLNNQDAIEEAEDLDGILDLIGMQGPIMGMVQNVIFSEFLITLTIAGSVWLPYIWGKIALLILANPVGMFVKAPLHIASKGADTVVDVLLFVAGLIVYAINSGASLSVHFLAYLFPNKVGAYDTTFFRAVSLSLTRGSGARLEKAISGAVVGLRPDLPTFSIVSHQALRTFEQKLANSFNATTGVFTSVVHGSPLQLLNFMHQTEIDDASLLSLCIDMARVKVLAVTSFVTKSVQTMSIDLGSNVSHQSESLDYSLIRWSTRDKILAIVLGYAFLSFVGYAYLKISRLIFGLKSGEKVEGLVADALSQAGGVMKVILIIGIEMIAFPLYCGLLLDIALMPLFAGVTLQSRLTFIARAPMTALFVHWFIGTCYMFHFALFVSMCRKVMRKGVLYFIRDPDDPTFHPVRDVLERPVAGQLSKIAFSAFVYGGLVILCLGGVIGALTCIEGVFPINWATNEPRLELPIDVIFYNFLLPVLIRKVEPSKKVAAMWEWWFRRCAANLRLTHFMFDEVKERERRTTTWRSWNPFASDESIADVPGDGTFVRAPASDSVRIPKGEKVFVEVNEKNERLDGQVDVDGGPHGRVNKNFAQLYIPPNFRLRIATFIFMIWLFAATTGILFTVGPMLLGRAVIAYLTQTRQPPNDLYAFTIGIHLSGAVAYAITNYQVCRNWLVAKIRASFRDTRQLFPKMRSTGLYLLGLVYVSTMFAVVLPVVFSMISELYFLLPLHTFLSATAASASSPNTATSRVVTELSQPSQYSTTVYILQTWTLGLLYLRLALRFANNYPNPNTRASVAMKAILRKGIMNPDIRLATRAFVLPALVSSAVVIFAPMALGWMLNAVLDVDPQQNGALRVKIYRYAYPGLMAGVLAAHCVILCKRLLGVWRIRIRDEVYLIGERLHNFGEGKRSNGVSSKTSQTGGRAGSIGAERVDVVDVR